jgi:hypothetical protein
MKLAWSDEAREAALEARRASKAARINDDQLHHERAAAANTKAAELAEGGSSESAVADRGGARRMKQLARKLRERAEEHEDRVQYHRRTGGKNMRTVQRSNAGGWPKGDAAIAAAWTDEAREASIRARQAASAAHAATLEASRVGDTDRRRFDVPSRRALAAMPDEGMGHRNNSSLHYAAAEEHAHAAQVHRDAVTKLTFIGSNSGQNNRHRAAARAHEAAAEEHMKAGHVHKRMESRPGTVREYGRGEAKVSKKTTADKHETMRVKTMSDKALANRIDKIANKDKMTRFASALRAAGKHGLAKQARAKAMTMSDEPVVTHEEFKRLYLSDEPARPQRPDSTNPLLADAEVRAGAGTVGSLNTAGMGEVRQCKAKGFRQQLSDASVIAR